MFPLTGYDLICILGKKKKKFNLAFSKKENSVKKFLW